ncbi:MAG: hypothetical protein H3C43_10080 [Leptonema sp. (in: Bacteria)]|nr:hypothetical protein [Leptonema sp. (in: bacteria)]
MIITQNQVSQFESAVIREALSVLDDSYFDGHTEFYRLNLQQRLQWISQVALFVTQYCGLARK